MAAAGATLRSPVIGRRLPPFPVQSVSLQQPPGIEQRVIDQMLRELTTVLPASQQAGAARNELTESCAFLFSSFMLIASHAPSSEGWGGSGEDPFHFARDLILYAGGVPCLRRLARSLAARTRLHLPRRTAPRLLKVAARVPRMDRLCSSRRGAPPLRVAPSPARRPRSAGSANTTRSVSAGRNSKRSSTASCRPATFPAFMFLMHA